MILEVADLRVREGEADAFEATFAQAQAIISSMPGYLGHELQRCVEDGQRYVLLVRWRSVEDHVEGFRGSGEYAQWKALLHRFYEAASVAHFERVG